MTDTTSTYNSVRSELKEKLSGLNKDSSALQAAESQINLPTHILSQDGHTHIYTDGSKKGFFVGSYFRDDDEDETPETVFPLRSPRAQSNPSLFVNVTPKVLKSDMTKAMVWFTMKIAQAATDRYLEDVEVSSCIKERLENARGGNWVTVVGSDFATFVGLETYRAGTMCHFLVGNQAFLVFQCQ